jgi:hypothetical protein
MPSAEQRGTEPPREQSPYPEYYQAASYVEEEGAGEAYFQAQEALFATSFNLSAFRFRLEQVSYVAVLGDTPSAEFDHTLQAILASGKPTKLPNDILKVLNQRRIQARGLGSWVEGHYHPGKRIGG